MVKRVTLGHVAMVILVLGSIINTINPLSVPFHSWLREKSISLPGKADNSISPPQRLLVKVVLFEPPFLPLKPQQMPIHCHFIICSRVWAPENVDIIFSALRWHLPQPPSGLI